LAVRHERQLVALAASQWYGVGVAANTKRKKRTDGGKAAKTAAIRSKPRPTKEVSVMAWVQDEFGRVLLVKQQRGRALWALPGGKVRTGEALFDALKREVKEETGLTVQSATLMDYYDRPERVNITFLFRITIGKHGRLKLKAGEIESWAFRAVLPAEVTPSLAYFWPRLKAQREARGKAAA
jgi:ADP-ribose pyrophosphatase YjhB (NUDIX family)